jgi:hypothetical protein
MSLAISTIFIVLASCQSFIVWASILASLALQCVGNSLLILMCSTFLQFPLINFLFNLGFWLCLVRYMEPQNIPGDGNKTLARVAFRLIWAAIWN